MVKYVQGKLKGWPLDMNADVYTLKEFAIMVGVTERTITRWTSDGMLADNRTDDGKRYYTQEQFDMLQAAGKTVSDDGTSRRKYARIKDRNDIVGMRFDKLKVVRCLSGDDVRPSLSTYECECRCGNKIVARRNDLLSGNTGSCGCSRTEAFVRKYNSDGDTTRRVISLNDLPGHRRTADISGEKFGRLVPKVISKAYVRGCGKTAVIWTCECRCGSMVDVDAQALRSGHTVSCGCYEKDHPGRFVDLTDRRFGMLIAKECVRRGGKNGYSLWRCECDCGRIKDVLSVNLVHGITCSCGCQSMSNAEMAVATYLTSIGLEAGFDYITQQRFSDLVSPKGRRLSYDFALYKNGTLAGLIECQGKQHYTPIEFFGGEEKFETQVEHDRMKRDYAMKRGVELAEMPYTITSQKSVDKYIFNFLNAIEYFE